MFASLKNKIKEETGSDVSAGAFAAPQRISNNNRMRSRFSSTISVNSTDDGAAEPQNNPHEQLSSLRGQCNELTTKVADLNGRLQTMQQEKLRVEKSNEILLETVKVSQTQKDIYCEEQEKIQNMQQAEIEKLKNLLSFREQEAVDRLAAQRQNQQQIENLTGELERLKKMEPIVEDLQDELERLQHSSQLGKNNLTTTLAAVEEENRHLKMRLQIVGQARLEIINTLGTDEKIQALIHERKLLEQHLEEAHLQLSDIKSSWSGQNLALETQLSRLSKQVAEETTEKRKALKARDDMTEKVKTLEFDAMKIKDELKHRDNKIKLLEEEIDELNAALKECREESEQQILFERNKVSSLESDTKELQMRLQATDDRFTDYAADAESIAFTLRQQLTQLQDELSETQNKFEQERDEKLTALLRNAEISQSEEILKKELRVERAEVNELNEKILQLEEEVKTKEQEVNSSISTLRESQTTMATQEEKLQELEHIQLELEEKNKTIKMLNQRLSDIKKTLQKELRNNKKPFDKDTTAPAEIMLDNGFASAMVTMEKSSCCNCVQSLDAFTFATNPSGGIVMDEVNFKYLKHVIVKFLTSREVEARHLIRAVATLLKLNKEEEQLLHDTLNWKMSWFGSKPDHGSGQRAVSIPPS